MTRRWSHRSLRAATFAGCGLFVLVAWLAEPPIVASPRPSTLHARYVSWAPVSEVIYPKQTLPLKFSHRKHLARAPLACTYCHDRAADSTSAIDNLMPMEADCATCHPIERSRHDKQVPAGTGPAACTACHTQFDRATGQVARIKLPIPNIKFNHKAHVDRNISCETCHGDMKNVDLATRKHLPKMALCLTCHDGKRAASACTTCHLAAPGGFVQTSFNEGKLRPSGVLRGAAHNATFAVAHRTAAQNDSKFCGNCHRKSECVSCHNGVRKPVRIHANDYLSIHVIEARRDNPKCSSCHRLQTFCVGCHSRAGVTADGRGSDYVRRPSADGRALYHPPGWVTFNNGSLSNTRGMMHHSFEAQRNIRQCAACHREDFCLRCHSAENGSFRRSPHPRNWRNSRRCEALAARAGRMCLRCHTNAREARCDYMP